MFSKKQRHQIYKLALEKLENDTHPLIADNIKDATLVVWLVADCGLTDLSNYKELQAGGNASN